MQRHVTIKLLAGSVTNDVLYIHCAQDAITIDGELADQVLALPIARLSWEPWLHHGQCWYLLTHIEKDPQEHGYR